MDGIVHFSEGVTLAEIRALRDRLPQARLTRPELNLDPCFKPALQKGRD